ncbi:hypothetical protein E2C01_003819 [Portunus trituberculatus]|uniref:Uncharacterized protein n=1 Tax=Portunus trituberculatus TaxID=210409 RepID=A0A5B7CN49_PORTR|nr:hypothetical protein [Portunus trituberculatus]
MPSDCIKQSQNKTNMLVLLVDLRLYLCRDFTE